jgi:transcriptional regulator with XRE-family HTH domain
MKDEAFFIQLGNHIAHLRVEAGMTQSELAEKIGVKNQQALGAYEKGIRRVPSSLLISLCDVFQISLDELLQVHTKKVKPGPVPKLDRQLKEVKNLSKSQQQFISQFLDTMLRAKAAS